jgi:methylase of polypeptide subunit release factors
VPPTAPAPLAAIGSDNWRRDHLPLITTELRRRPGHEKVRTLLHQVLVQGLGVASEDIDYEHRVPRVRGRIDALLGNVVIEIKSDLGREAGDVLARLPDYLGEAEAQTRRRFVGIATDGATWEAYELRDGAMVLMDRFALPADRPATLLAWLEPAFQARGDLIPDAATIASHLGAGSLTWMRARRDLEGLWAGLREDPEIVLKRRLWADLLGQAQGTPEETTQGDALFLQHTYLTIVAKTIAAHVLEVAPVDAEAVLSGAPLAEMGIAGAVEGDFFDWILRAGAGGEALVMGLMRHTARLRLNRVGDDVMKRIYESLIPRDERYRLGEYYTPDWLASRIVRKAVTDPLNMRVLDPACGSGTFLFHAIRHFLAAADEAGWEPSRAVEECVFRVRGMDVHPVAVILARVTWLLAIGVDRLRQRPNTFSVPVFMGDALQVNVRLLGDATDLAIPVPGETRPLHIPGGLAEDQARFDTTVSEITHMVEEGGSPEAFAAWLRRQQAPEGERRLLVETYKQLQRLHAEGRDHIWGFVLRNLARPLWLAREQERVDVVVGNPPWLPFRSMSPGMKREVKAMCEARSLWRGGILATQMDLSALFVARCAELYLKPNGTLAMVMPYAVLNRPAFEGVREGNCGTVSLRITGAWAMRNEVKPLFPTSSCVLFAQRAAPAGLPATVRAMAGSLSRRDAREEEVNGVIVERDEPWPPVPRFGESHYRRLFLNGATVFPRRFFLVERREVGRLGGNTAEPLLRGRTGSMDKEPWRNIDPPEGRVEREFLKPILMGENLAPFRVLEPLEAVIPIAPGASEPMDAKGAANDGWPRLAGWLSQCEAAWDRLSGKDSTGKPRVSLTGRLNHFRALSAQFPPKPLRVAYAASGTLFAAALLRDGNAICEHKLYWHAPRSEAEAYYLLALLNAEVLRLRIVGMQSQGWQDPRDFDKLIFEQAIPAFDRREALHNTLADAARRAEALAATVPMQQGVDFRRNRTAIRNALTENGISAEMDALVVQLIPE